MIYVHRYTLCANAGAPLNAVSKRVEFEGALIRVGSGFGCIHPWPELGDAPLDQQLLALSEGRTTPLIERALHCCRIDGLARERGENLFDGLEIPESHYTLPPDEFDVPAEFAAVKIKGRDSPITVALIQNLPPRLRVRVDFNETLNAETLLEFWEALGDCRDQIEFLEDPVPFDAAIWREMTDTLGCPLAVDRAVDTMEVGARFRVVKPAVNDSAAQQSLAELFRQKLVFTSYMDHPLGQLYAAYEAANALRHNPERVVECGLVTHHLFDASDPFVSALGPPRPKLLPPAGTGLGFDRLLHDLTWIPLTNTTSSC